MSLNALPLLGIPALLSSVALFGLLVAAIVTDVTRFRIPNVIPTCVVFLFLAKMILGIEGGPFISHLLMAVVALLLGFLAFAAGLMGGGDAKLIAAFGLWFGPEMFGSFITITGLAGGVFALLLLVVRRPSVLAFPADTAAPSPPRHRLLDPKAPVPYALPIAFAALWLEWL